MLLAGASVLMLSGEHYNDRREAMYSDYRMTENKKLNHSRQFMFRTLLPVVQLNVQLTILCAYTSVRSLITTSHLAPNTWLVTGQSLQYYLNSCALLRKVTHGLSETCINSTLVWCRSLMRCSINKPLYQPSPNTRIRILFW